LWLLDVSTRADVRIPVSPPNIDTMARQTLGMLREDIYDDLVRDLLGREWRAQFANELDTLVIDIKRAISQGMSEGEGIPDLMRRVRDRMGIQTDRRSGYRQNFNRVQAIVRTTVNTASNNGTMEAYRRNADILSGAHWLAARDERTCPRCGGLDGTFIRLGDSLRPPAHINCRCTLIPAIREDLLVPYDEPPRQTLSEWADAFGLSMLLTDFLSARRLQSDRIG
jgi:SPP1 gp7 family putative phage head morphogenesis protein